MSLSSVIRQIIEVLKEILLSVFVHKALDAKEAPAPAASKDTKKKGDTKKKEDAKEGSTAPVVPPTNPKESFAAGFGRWLEEKFSDNMRNDFIAKLLRLGDAGTMEGILDIENEMLNSDDPLAENTFAKILAGITADAKAKLSDEEFKKFFTGFIALAKDDPTRFKALVELSNNNIVQQYLRAGKKFIDGTAASLNEKYGTPSWVRRERSAGDGTVAGNFAETLLPSVTGIWSEIWARVPGTAARKAKKAAAARARLASKFGIDMVPESEVSAENPPVSPEPIEPAVDTKKAPIGMFGFLGKVVGDLWSTANWYLRRFLILIAGLLLTSVSFFVLGWSWILVVIAFLTIGAVIHLAIIRFQYPLILVGIAGIEESRKVVGYLTFALVGVCTLSLVLAVLAIAIDGRGPSVLEARMLIGTSVLVFVGTFFAPKGKRSAVRFVLVLTVLIGTFPGLLGKLPERYAKTAQAVERWIDSTKTVPEPVVASMSAPYVSFAAVKVPPTLRPGWTPAPQPGGVYRDTLTLIGRAGAESRAVVSQEANTSMLITVTGKGDSVTMFRLRQSVSGVVYERAEMIAVNATTHFGANDGTTIVPDYKPRFMNQNASSTDTTRVVIRILLPGE